MLSQYSFLAAQVGVTLAALLQIAAVLVARRRLIGASAGHDRHAEPSEASRASQTRLPSLGVTGLADVPLSSAPRRLRGTTHVEDAASASPFPRGEGGQGVRFVPAPHSLSRDERSSLGAYSSTLSVLGFLFLTLALVSRTIGAGRGPFANMYEFAVAFAWGVVGAALYVERHYRAGALGALVLAVGALLLAYASTLPSAIQPLVPALQNNLLLTVHVGAAILAYGTFAVSFGAAVLHLYQLGASADWLPSAEELDVIGYRAVTVGFPAMALVIILGAIWADVAWGSYWSWDPKETASLVTWLIYGGYLHARRLPGWRGRRSAVLLILGFLATLVTYFGNTFFGGLHSYSGLG